MANYYVVQDGDSTGPFDRDRLAQLIAARTLLPDTLVWTADMNDWAPARDVADIVGLFPDLPPPPIPTKRPPPPRGAPAPSPASGAWTAQEFGRLQIGAAMSAGYTALRRRPSEAMAAVLVCSIPPILIDPHLWFTGNIGPDGLFTWGGGAWVLGLFNLCLATILYCGLCVYMINLVRGAPTSLDQVFTGFSRWLSVLAYLILVLGALVLGLLALVLPGVFLAICFLLTPFILMDGGLPATGAMSASFRAVMRLGWWRTFALFLLLVIIVCVFWVAVALVYGIVTAFSGYNGEEIKAGIIAVFLQSDVGTEWLLSRMVIVVVFAPLTVYFTAIYAAVYEQARTNEERRQDQA